MPRGRPQELKTELALGWTGLGAAWRVARHAALSVVHQAVADMYVHKSWARLDHGVGAQACCMWKVRQWERRRVVFCWSRSDAGLGWVAHGATLCNRARPGVWAI